MKNHMKLALLLLVISILMFAFVGCQTKKNSTAVSPDVSSLNSDLSSDIISSDVSSTNSSSSDIASSSKSVSISSKAISSVNPTTTIATINSKDITAELAKEESRHKSEIDKINAYYKDQIDKTNTTLNELNLSKNKANSQDLSNINLNIAKCNADLEAYKNSQNGALADELKKYNDNIAKIKG